MYFVTVATSYQFIVTLRTIIKKKNYIRIIIKNNYYIVLAAVIDQQ